MVNVTRSNYLTELSHFLHHLPTASFISIDEEMTGISLRNPDGSWSRPNKFDLPNERYQKSLKGVPEKYSILQVGVALFHRNPHYRPDGGSDGGGSNGAEGDVVVRGARGQAQGDVDEDDADAREHSFLHREGMLNTDELEDLTEREEEGEAPQQSGGSREKTNGGAAAAATVIVTTDGESNTTSEEESKPADDTHPSSEYISRTYNFYLFPGTDRDQPRHSNNNNSHPYLQREVTLDPSAIKFLIENKMDFDKVFREGISFTTCERGEFLKGMYFEKYFSEKDESSNNIGDAEGSKTSGSRPKVKLTRPEDIAFVARTMANLREWIDSDAVDGDDENGSENDVGEDGGVNGGNENNGNGAHGDNSTVDAVDGGQVCEGTSLVLPPCNAFLRRCLYETIEAEYPGLILERADNHPNGGAARNQIRVIRLSPAEKESRQTRIRLDEWHKLLQDTLGFTSVFRAISDACNGKSFTKERIEEFLEGRVRDPSVPDDAENGGIMTGRQIPIVIHNGLMDLMFLMTHCHHPVLPDEFEDTKKVIRKYFPCIYDTKILSSEYSDAVIQGGSSALGELYTVVCNDELNLDVPFKPPPIANQGADGATEQAHEAAWDAYMTGCVFSALCRRVIASKYRRVNGNVSLDSFLHNSRDDILRYSLGLNKIYMHMSLYTIDLESTSGPIGLHDPLTNGLSVETTFLVSGFNCSVSTRDILQSLMNVSRNEEELLQHLKYEIIWLNDTSLLVGTKVEEEVALESLANKNIIASHVRNKLHAGLGSVKILNLVEYFEDLKSRKELPVKPVSSGFAGSIFSGVKRALGLGEKRSSEEGGIEGQRRKRMRVG
mmetsp:Transcript_4858/g.9894  ORF Transcript_4858/g.9894 Transcript_4858/m.9894 type:complete len:836 (+) Transcript_4858:58-2565(+)